MKRILCAVLSLAVLTCSTITGTVFAAKETGDFNVGYEATVNVTDEGGLPVVAGHRGENLWRTDIQSINDYFVHDEPNFWGYSYTLPESALPVNVDFDYGMQPADIGQITLAENLRKDDAPDRGTYNKIYVQYYNGTEWATIIMPSDTNGAYTVDSDGAVNLNWAAPSRTEPLTSHRLRLIDLDLGGRYVSDKIRIKIVGLGELNGDCWGEFGIDEILMYGKRAEETAAASNGDSFLNYIGEKAYTEAEKLATTEEITKALAVVSNMADNARKDELTQKLNKLAAKAWTNLALNATASAGENEGAAVKLNDGDEKGRWENNWSASSTELGDSSWIMYDYGKEVTINRMDFGSRFVANAVTGIEVYGIKGSEETKIGTYKLVFNRVPQDNLYNKDTPLSKEAYDAFERYGQLDNGEIYYSDFSSVIFESSFVCDKVKVKLTSKLEANQPAAFTEVRTWGTEGAAAEYNYTATNKAFIRPVALYDQNGEKVEPTNAGGIHKLSLEYLNDYAIYPENSWYETALPADKLPFFIEYDYEGEMTEINSIKLGVNSNCASGLVKKLSVQMFDGTDWVDVPLAAAQPTGVTASGIDAELDWTNPSEVNSNSDKSFMFMEVKFAEPTIGYKLRVLIKDGSSDGGILHVEELMTYGWNPNMADIESREESADILKKYNDYTIERVLNNPTEKNITAARAVVAKMNDADKAVYTKVIDRNGEWDKLTGLSGSSGMGIRADTLTDGKIRQNYGWDSNGTEISDRSWVQVDFAAASRVKTLRIAENYFPCAVTKVNIYAKVGTEYILLKENVATNFANAPELSWYKNDIPFEVEGKQAYTEAGLMREDGGDMAKGSWVDIDLPDVTCNGIRIQILSAQLSWGGYGVGEIEVIGKTAEEGSVIAAGQKLCLTDGTQTSSLADAKANGGYLTATIGNPSDKTKTAVMLVVYYKNGDVAAIDSKTVELNSKAVSKDQNLALDFTGAKAECDSVKAYILSEIASETGARGTNTQLELR